MITIIDYGMGNLRSVEKIFQRLKIDISISSNLDDINNAKKIVLPGVGHFQNGMRKLQETGIKDVLNKKILQEKTPILGICLGMQLMTNHSEEGNVDGLGWIDGETKRFNFESKKIKIPHMGWNQVEIAKESVMTKGIDGDNSFYFVHSYFVSCNDENDILFKSTYHHSFVSGFEKNNIVGVQFHPEKSHQYGMQLIKNFIEK